MSIKLPLNLSGICGGKPRPSYEKRFFFFGGSAQIFNVSYLDGYWVKSALK